MKRKNTTRNALFTSIISLLLCVSMLVGTTFAWFTDSVVSGNNVIAAGNLDIELYNDGNKVTSQTNLFDGVKWEPGVVDYENFTIKNEGNLALLYDFAMNWGDYNTLAGEYNLTQILKVAMVDKHVSGDRAAAIAAGEAAGWKSLSDWSFSGEMTTKGETKDFALIIYWEPSDADNNWNVQNGKTLDKGEYLYVKLGINLQATQKMHESDSFGTDYDSLASAWDGSVGEVPAENEGVITLTTGAELAAFAASVNGGTTYSGKTVKLGADINLGNVAWTAIGDCESGNYFQGTFDGQGHTIYNLNVDYSKDASEFATAGLFGWVDAAAATIKNLNVDGATVKGSHWTGVIAGFFTGTIENCSVNNATVIAYNLNDDANGDKVGGIVGYMNSGAGKLDGNTVTNSTITGNRDVAGLAGAVATTNAVTNNKVENVTVNYSSDYVGEIVSPKTAVVVDDTNTATNVTLASAWDGSVGEVPAENEGVITLTTGAELAAFAASVNGGTTYSGKTVKLGADINLGNVAWTPIGDCQSGKYFQGTFDGQGHTIYNLSVDKSNDTYKNSCAGLFGWVDAAGATIKNVKLDNATVMGSHWVGAVAGYFTGRIENCSVSNSTIMGFNVNDDANGDKVGGIVGYLNEHSYINGNTVSNTEITGNRDIGGIAGSVAASTYEMKNNTVKDTTLCYSEEKSYASAGEFVSGRTGYAPDDTNTASNVKIIRVINVQTVAELNDALAALSADALNTAAILRDCNDTSGVVKIPAAYTGTLTLKDSTIASVQAEGNEMDPRAAVTFENCTIGGVALTEENLSTLVTSNISNATVK